MQRAKIDRLMQSCRQNAEKIAEQWYQSLSTNARTTTCMTIPREGALRHAVTIYRSIADMYFSEDCFHTVERVFDADGFAEDFYARGVPLEEVIYALTLLRRHIWLHADSQALFDTTAIDMYSAVESINRTLLVFDYANYIVASKYRKFAG